ncbi:MAG: asparagine synthase-related protein, partial [Proteobacteria bacterium]|nr:asparagine synthase-related protein [Pseudomonadota bacterium]
LLLLLGRTTMAFGVEGRVPFLDHRLVEAALAVPERVRTPGGAQKGLERRMAAAYLPPDVLAAPKHGFVAPVQAWMATNMGAPARRILESTRALERGWWTKAGIARLFADPHRHAWRIYSLLMLELAVRTTVEYAGRTPPTATLAEMADEA